jgi:c-di-GMP-binding flagellar brake protein YcgR
LANALAHLLAIQDVEPARNFARIDVSFKAESLDSPDLALRLADISPGGMRFVVEGQMSSRLEMGSRLAVFIHREAQEIMILAKVAWMAGKNELGSVASSQIQDSFGIDFLALSDDAAEVVESIMESRFQPERMVLAFQPPSDA